MDYQVSMVEFRTQSIRIMKMLRGGRRIVLTYRGKPVARLEPILEDQISEDDPFYAISDLADAEGTPLTNRAMDEIIYGD